MSGLSAYTPATLGDRQEWRNQTASRSVGTAYLNSTGRAIAVAVTASADAMRDMRIADDAAFSVNAVAVGRINGSKAQEFVSCIIPAGKYYRLEGPVLSIGNWAELS